MVNVFIIHGSYGSPEENWFPWLKRELEKKGCKVFVPRFPTPKNQTLKNWIGIFDSYDMDENSLVIGHSTGCAFLLNVLEKKGARAAFLVSGFTGKLDNPRFDELNRTFAERDFDWNMIKSNCKKFYLFHSDNDSYVPLGKAEELAESLGTDIILIKGAGHFNDKSGYVRFEKLLEIVRPEL